MSAIALLYLAGVALYWFLVRAIGEHWWFTAMLTFLPRHLLLVPALGLAAILWRSSKRFAIAYAMASSALILAFAGLHLNWPARSAQAPAIRVLSYNIWYDHANTDDLAREIDKASPDIALFQALGPSAAAFFTARFKGSQWHTHANAEFYLATKYPIRTIVETPSNDDRPPFIRYTIDSPIGTIDVFNVHLLSPRSALAAFKESKREWLWGRGTARTEILANVEARSIQARAVDDAVRRSTNPVIVAGDTNLPEHSRVFSETLGGLRDGFADAGLGLGYTYPANVWIPWMRIDRILCSDALEFERFSVTGGRGLDHYAVAAVVAKRPPVTP